MWTLMESVLFRFGQVRHSRDQTTTLLVAALLSCTTLALDTSELVCLLAGAVAYALMSQKLRVRSGRRTQSCRGSPPAKWSFPQLYIARSITTAKPKTSPAQGEHSMPKKVPAFRCKVWEDDIEELISTLVSTNDDDLKLKQLEQFVRQAASSIMPGVEVASFLHASPSATKAFGVAVPDVELVLKMDLLRLPSLRGKSAAKQDDSLKLQKYAIRELIHHLVSKHSFKFRRSAFRCKDPKVTLITPDACSIFPKGVAVDLRINSTVTGRNAELLARCCEQLPLTRDLALLVQYWARNRGIIYASGGHLPPYAWNVLTVFFLQVSDGNGKQMLPPLTDKHTKIRDQPIQKTVAMLLKEFFHFYHNNFNFKREVVSASTGVRRQRSRPIARDCLLQDEGCREVALAIEDPFDTSEDLGLSMTAFGVFRLREEISRASTMCTQQSSLSDLLTLWSPPDALEE